MTLFTYILGGIAAIDTLIETLRISIKIVKSNNRFANDPDNETWVW